MPPVPTSIDDLSTTASSNSPAGSESPTDGDNYIRTYGSFIAILRDKLDGDSNTGVIRNATFSGTMAGAASWSGLQTFAAGISVSTGGNVLSGTWTPTLTLVSNVASATAESCHYIRVGNQIHAEGFISSVDCTSASGTLSRIGISLPVASDLAAGSDLGGTGSMYWQVASVAAAVVIAGDATNNRAEASFPAQSTSTTSTRRLGFSFTYTVI